ncbi:hypothetical protein NDU88_002968 [Pleurodeles waltl]|uniref:Uncharacterized protein n=1 Tax=Pleurodeles waltl TaxID=8319 RepID=A0AAV7MPI0_PLEWA|nr:hypothetical protein NDU88_002968 [Pleurodeles waltl]
MRPGARLPQVPQYKIAKEGEEGIAPVIEELLKKGILREVYFKDVCNRASPAAAARHDASDQADASCPRLPVAGATRSERGRGKAVARETGWVSRRGINKREDGTGREEEEQERRAEEKRQETEQEKRAQEEEQERRAQETEQERRAQERRPEEQERRAQEKEQERRAQEKEQERRAQERRPEEQERRAQERETKKKTAGEETAAEERHNASHDPGGSWLTKGSNKNLSNDFLVFGDGVAVKVEPCV